MKPKIEEGMVFSLPLKDDLFALGVVARIDKGRTKFPYGVFAYFFGPYGEQPSPSSINVLQAAEAELDLNAVYFRCMTGDGVSSEESEMQRGLIGCPWKFICVDFSI